jgi:hypothetical protein
MIFNYISSNLIMDYFILFNHTLNITYFYEDANYNLSFKYFYKK